MHFFRPISSLSVSDSVKVTAIQKRWIAKTLDGYKKDGLNFFVSGLPVTLDSVVVYRVKERDEKLYEWPDWERYALYYDRAACTSRDMVEWVKLD